MNQIAKLCSALLLGASILFTGCSKDKHSSETIPVVNERDVAVKDYNEMYVTTTTVTDEELAWTGNTANCQEGTISQIAIDKSLKRINYFRKICGLPYNVVMNPAWFSGCQKSALMMYANNALNHFPPSTWKCYTTEGYNTSGGSNLSLGYPRNHTTNSVTGWIQDAGTNNTAAGHRRWILFSRAKEFGLGCTICTAALYCTAHTTDPLPANSPQYIAYPPKYIPQNLVFARWSLGIPHPVSNYFGVDFTNATVQMTDNSGKNISLNVISRNDDGYGDQTIIWEPQGVITNSTTDLKYHVIVDKVVVSGTTQKYEYDVNIIKP